MKIKQNKEFSIVFISQKAFINKALIATDIKNFKKVNLLIISTPNLFQYPKPVAN